MSFRLVLLAALVLGPTAAAQQVLSPYEQALAHHAAGKLSDAINAYGRAIAADPRRVDAYINRACCFIAQHRPGQGGNVVVVRPGRPIRPPAPTPLRKALADLQRATMLDPASALAFHNRAVAYAKLGSAARARVDMDRALALSSPDGLLQVHRALVRQLAGDRPGALRDAELATGVTDPPAEAYYTRAQLLHASGQGKAAAEHYRRAIELASPSKPAAAPKKPAGPDPRVPKLVEQLGARTWKDREAATKALIAIGTPAVEAVKGVLTSDDPEIQQRAQRILDAIAKGGEGPVAARSTLNLVNRPAIVALARAGLEALEGKAPRPLTLQPIPADLDKLSAK